MKGGKEETLDELYLPKISNASENPMIVRGLCINSDNSSTQPQKNQKNFNHFK